MFEKEAEKYATIPLADGYERIDFQKKKDWQKGAEFGYNKAFVEADKNLKAIVADFNKANEWHYVKDGDLPKVNELVLIKITGCLVLGWTNGTDWFNDSNNGTIIDRRMVYAWKEIVLPELKEE